MNSKNYEYKEYELDEYIEVDKKVTFPKNINIAYAKCGYCKDFSELVVENFKVICQYCGNEMELIKICDYKIK